MASKTLPPTRVEAEPPGLKESVAHGRDRDWSKVGRSATVSITAPVHVLQWLRANGYVYSRVFTEASLNLMGSTAVDHVDREIKTAEDHLTLLHATRRALQDTAAGNAKADAREQDRLERLQKLAEAFFEQGRDDSSRYSTRNNLNWVSGRISKDPVLSGSPAEQILDLVVKSRREVPA